jgi:hypothetical protein
MGREVTDDDFLKVGATVLQNASYLSLPASHIESAIEAYETVIKEAGASLKRDEVDSRLIRHIKSKGKEGMIIHSEEEVGGLKPIRSQKLKNQDTDSDGMPDQWEKNNPYFNFISYRFSLSTLFSREREKVW